jgi:hypothetical protein
MVWMSTTALDPSRDYIAKHTTRQVRARVSAVRYKFNINTVEKENAAELRMNEIGSVLLETSRPLFFDPYRRNRVMGSFILIDPISNETVAAGMITGREAREPEPKALVEGLQYESSRVTLKDREDRAGHRAVTVWIEGNEEAAYSLERELFHRGCLVHVLAGRRHFHLVAELAKICNAIGLITICSVPPDAAIEVEVARDLIGADRLLELDPAAASVDSAITALENGGFIPRF